VRKVICGVVCVVGVLLLAIGPSTAGASTMTLALGTEPVESITTQVSATGTDASTENDLSVKVQPTGGEPCGANNAADQGETVIGEFTGEGNGPHSESVNWTFRSAGSYLLCGWLTDETQAGDPVVAKAELTVSVRPPHIAITISTPATVLIGQAFQIATTAQAETSRTVYEYVEVNTGDGCPANAQAAGSTSGDSEIFWPHQDLGEWNVNGGPFTEAANAKLEHIGSYLVCAYAEYPNGESAPEATATAMISVITPPPPCVVPSFTQKMRISTVERRITAAHCTVGKVEHSHSQRIHRGYVIRLSSRPGAKLAAQASVAIVVSSGPRKRSSHRR
jgi:hypothetical protein